MTAAQDRGPGWVGKKMAEAACDDRPLTFEDLVAWFDEGSKPKSDWRVGAEHEKFVFRLGSHEPVPYEPKGIKALLDGLTRFGWAPVLEGDNVIALERGKANVSLEPGGQFELSGAPLETIHDICDETGQHLQPVCTALFANSPFIEGKPSGFVSARANVWTDTDPDRTGMLDFVFRDGFGFETYAKYALAVPMYFAKRDGRYLDLSGRSFKDF